MPDARSSASLVAVRESKTVTSKRKARVMAATAVAKIFRPVENEWIIFSLAPRLSLSTRSLGYPHYSDPEPAGQSLNGHIPLRGYISETEYFSPIHSRNG